MIKPCTYVRKKTAKGAKVKCRMPNHFWALIFGLNFVFLARYFTACVILFQSAYRKDKMQDTE